MKPVKNFVQSDMVQISPESLAIANTYLNTQSIDDTAEQLGVERSTVILYMNRPEVKNYINTVYLDGGYRSRFKLAAAIDRIIDKKLEELEEAEIGSSKDIADLLAMAHKMRMDEMKAMTELEKVQNQNIRTQTNIQINDGLGSSNYSKLLEQLTRDASSV